MGKGGCPKKWGALAKKIQKLMQTLYVGDPPCQSNCYGEAREILSRPPKPPSQTTETTFGIGTGYVTRDGKREIQTLCNDSANDSEVGDFVKKIYEATRLTMKPE